MKVIYKYALQLTTQQVVPIDEMDVIRHVGVQDDTVMLWVEIDESARMTQIRMAPPPPEIRVPYKRLITMVGTGMPFSTSEVGDYLGTVQLGSFVWHVYHRMVR